MTAPHFPRYLRLNIVDDSGEGIDLGSLHCRFEIERIGSVGISTAVIAITNLSRTTIGRLLEEFRRIQIVAGYGTDARNRSGIIFDGEIKNVFTTHQGTDRITEIYAKDGAKAWERSRVNLSFRGGQSLRSVVRSVMASFGDATAGSLEGLTDQTLVGGQVFSGMSRDALDELAESYGFEWSIQDGVIEARDIARAAGETPIEISAATGMIGTPVATLVGTEVVSLINPAIRPGGLIRIVTAGAQASVGVGVAAGANLTLVGESGGVFRVLRVLHTGGTRGEQPWYTIATSQGPDLT